MALTPLQTRLLEGLAATTTAAGSAVIRYRSEWLGWLPYGVYHWIEVGGRDVSSELPSGWSSEDLHRLEQAGHLRLVETWQSPEDEFDLTITYELCAPGAEPPC